MGRPPGNLRYVELQLIVLQSQVQSQALRYLLEEMQGIKNVCLYPLYLEEPQSLALE